MKRMLLPLVLAFVAGAYAYHAIAPWQWGRTDTPAAAVKTNVSHEHPFPRRPPVTLGIAHYDFDHDGAQDLLSLVWVDGDFEDDLEPWCGAGEKYFGRFVLRVEFANGKSVDTPLEALKPEWDFFFCTEIRPWPIVLADYNHDGQADFNLVAYGACSFSIASLFTVLKSGRVENLVVEGGDLVIDSEYNSTTDFQPTTTGFEYVLADRLEGRDEHYSFTWDAGKNAFSSKMLAAPWVKN